MTFVRRGQAREVVRTRPWFASSRRDFLTSFIWIRSWRTHTATELTQVRRLRLHRTTTVQSQKRKKNCDGNIPHLYAAPSVLLSSSDFAFILIGYDLLRSRSREIFWNFLCTFRSSKILISERSLSTPQALRPSYSKRVDTPSRRWDRSYCPCARFEHMWYLFLVTAR